MNVIAHGGAGGSVEQPEQRQSVLEQAVSAGERRTTPVDAVIETVRQLESSPRFNAGVGGAIQSDGVVRTDAGVMSSDREVGAVCSMPGVEHASEAASIVMEETPHVLVAGERAVASRTHSTLRRAVISGASRPPSNGLISTFLTPRSKISYRSFANSSTAPTPLERLRPTATGL